MGNYCFYLLKKVQTKKPTILTNHQPTGLFPLVLTGFLGFAIRYLIIWTIYTTKNIQAAQTDKWIQSFLF